MDVRTNFKSRLPGRRVTAALARASHGSVTDGMGVSTHAALHLPTADGERGNKLDRSHLSEIFKKTPNVADLKPRGRDVAKDMFEVGELPLLMKPLLDHGFSQGDFPTVSGRSIADISKNVKWNPHQDVACDGGCIGLDADVGAINVKLTKAELAGRQTKWKLRQTNPTSGVLRKNAQQVGPALNGAVTHPGGSHEKQSYAHF